VETKSVEHNGVHRDNFTLLYLTGFKLKKKYHTLNYITTI